MPTRRESGRIRRGAAFVAATGVDALAVAVGSSHAMTERSAALDLAADRPAEGAVLDVPLVLHGSSGVADERNRGRYPGRA